MIIRALGFVLYRKPKDLTVEIMIMPFVQNYFFTLNIGLMQVLKMGVYNIFHYELLGSITFGYLVLSEFKSWHGIV